LVLFVFFFQAEDGIRDRNVTGVQTCALPIFTVGSAPILVWFSSAPPGNPHGRWLLLWLCLLRTRRLLGLRCSRLLCLRWLRRGLRWPLSRGSLGLLGWASLRGCISLRRARRRLRRRR